MGSFYVINDNHVKEILEIKAVIAGVEKAYRLKAAGEAGVFPVITYEWVRGTKDMDIKAGRIDGDLHIYGMKALTYIEGNDARGLPRLNGTMMIFDSIDGQLRGIIDSRSITGFRTGAAGAIGSKYLAKPRSNTLLLVGAGSQALNNLAGHLLTMKNLNRVIVFDPVAPQMAEEFARTAKERLSRGMLKNHKELLPEITITAAYCLEDACAQADIITTVTPSLTPIVKREWVKPGTHINCVGADLEGKQEVDETLLPYAKVVVDDIGQSVSIGELEVGVKKGAYHKKDIYGEIGNIINGDIPGRCDEKEITLFDTSGLALQDLIVAGMLLDKAAEMNLEKIEI
jgi:ornithine cyclodeaminase/alanine dehydrogenase